MSVLLLAVVTYSCTSSDTSTHTESTLRQEQLTLYLGPIVDISVMVSYGNLYGDFIQDGFWFLTVYRS